MKKLLALLMVLATIGMLTACGSSSSDSDSRSTLGGVAANAPILNANVTITDINGTVMATGTTGANGAYSLNGGITASPFIVTISATPTSTFANGAAFKGELKGLFTAGDPTTSLMVTVPSSLLYGIWDGMGQPTDITSARAAAESLLQALGIDTSAITNLWTSNPVGLSYEIINQQLVFLCGEDDASGASEILTRANNLGNAYASNSANAMDHTAGSNSVAGLISSYTGINVGTGGGSTYATFNAMFQVAAIKNQIASAAQQGLVGTTAASEASSIDTVLAQVETQNTAATAFLSYPGSITLTASGNGLITNTNLTQNILYASSTTTYGVTISGKQVDGTAATAGAFSVGSLTSGLTSDAAATFNSGTTVTFTVPTGTPGTYSATVTYTETVSGTDRSLTQTFSFKVLPQGAYSASGATFSNGPEALIFTDTTKNKVTLGTEDTTGTNTTQGQFKPTHASKDYICAFYLPDGMYFLDGTKQWQNWDVVHTSTGTGTQTVSLPASKTVRANKDLTFGDYSWTFRVFDENRDSLLTSSSDTGLVYSTGGRNTVRQILGNKYNSASTRTYATSGADETLTAGTNGYVTLANNFTGAIQTWDMAAGIDTGNTNITAGGFYLNVKSSNFDDYSGKKIYGFTSSSNQNLDVTANTITYSGTPNFYCTFIIPGGSTAFYPDYGAGLTNADKIRIGYEYTLDSKSATNDTLSGGVTFSKKN